MAPLQKQVEKTLQLAVLLERLRAQLVAFTVMKIKHLGDQVAEMLAW
jgi:hypothetical protein